MDKLRRELWTFCKAQVSAQVATVCDFAMTLLLAEVVGLWYVASTFIGALTGGVVNCAVNYRWVFHAQSLDKRFVALKYLMVWAGSIALNTGGTYLLTEVSGVYFIVAKVVVAILVGVLWNYQLQRFFVYRDTHLMGKLKDYKMTKLKDKQK